jgi:hypothetical protein
MKQILPKISALLLAGGVLAFVVVQAGLAGCRSESTARVVAEPLPVASETTLAKATAAPNAHEPVKEPGPAPTHASAPGGAAANVTPAPVGKPMPRFLPATKAGPVFQPQQAPEQGRLDQ